MLRYRQSLFFATLVLALAVPAAAVAAPAGRDDLLEPAPTQGPISSSVRPQVLSEPATVEVMVQLDGDPVAVAEAKADRRFTAAERRRLRQAIRADQDGIVDDVTTAGGTVTGQVQSAYNGVRVRIGSKAVDALADLPGVAGVHAITPKSFDNTTAVAFLGVPAVWQDTGRTGQGVTVGIIDTGIDYTHADFGGPGTADAFAAAAAASAAAADPAWFGPSAPRVKGGYDFVGDDYDADAGTPAEPDDNPLDCNGHGTHVAGSAGGSGVTADGRTFTGPYDADTGKVEFEVGPGVAPQVDLYALRVFGCSGTTDRVVDAIDWAVANGLDVINLSLGGPFGREDDPDAVAASNAVAAGVVVVTSAGNEGGNPYLAGAPGVGDGVVSVAAVDSTATFPGATLHLPEPTLTAINANGADLPEPKLTVVTVGDDPSTDVNESLGCSVAAFEAAGIKPGAHQIAVARRGDCARASKAIYGQEAGAAAVVMVNNEPGLPPYEGEIIRNPDTGEPAEVTIPFLGVEESADEVLAAAHGDQLSLTALTLDNDNYRRLASFSSGGPVNGSSEVGPQVAAPGVSIASAAIGTGTGAELMSGTSMAAPQVAGVAALSVQAHPDWRAAEVAAALVNTADPDAVKDSTLAAGGVGLVDAARAVATTSFATGDAFGTASGRAAEPGLSFGVAETSGTFTGTRTITIVNTGSEPVSYAVAGRPDPESVSARLEFGRSSVRVPAGGRATVPVTLRVDAADAGSSLAGDPFGFRQASGVVTLTAGDDVLRVPYLLVPRAAARVDAQILGNTGSTELNVRLRNNQGALDASADFYTWGLSDNKDVHPRAGGNGYDLRAAGVQAFDYGSGRLVLFAVNTHDRWSTAATQEFDVSVDTTGDGRADYVVFSYDSGYLDTGEYNGITGTYVYDPGTGELRATGFVAVAPTDSATILLPVYASDLGLTEKAGDFSYTVDAYSIEAGAGSDSFGRWARYNPWTKALADADYVTVPRGRTVGVTVTVDADAVAAQRPEGLMVVAFDNESGAPEAQLLKT